MRLLASDMSNNQTGSFDRYVLEQKYADAWAQQLPASTLRRVYTLRIVGAQLANCWSDHALVFLSEKHRMCRIVQHVERCVHALATCAPEYLESIADSDIIDINQDVAAQLLQHPPAPSDAFRLNWTRRSSSVFCDRIHDIKLRVQEFNKVLARCLNKFSRNAQPDLHFIPPEPEWTSRSPPIQARRVIWKFSTIMRWTCVQLGCSAVQHAPEIRSQVLSVRTALLNVRAALRALSQALDVFIYLEWRAVARRRTVSMVWRVMNHVCKRHSAFGDSSLGIPEGIAQLVAYMLVGEGPHTFVA